MGAYPVFGYGYPDFDIEDTSNTESQKIIKNNTTSSSGLSKTVQWYGKVNCSALNVRTWAGTEYNRFMVIGGGKEVEVCDTVKAKNGDPWYYVKVNGKYGFVSAKYIA